VRIRLTTSVEGIVAFLVPIALYLPLLSQHFDLNGIAEARALEMGDLFSPNHLLYRPLGLLLHDSLSAFGFNFRTLVVLQVVTAISGAAGIAFAFLFFRRFTRNTYLAGAVAFWLGTAWANWAYSTDAIYIPVAAMFVAAALAAFMSGHSRVSLMLAGYLAGFAILVWEANVFLIPIFLTGIALLNPMPGRERWRLSFWFLLACAVPVVSLYGLAAISQGVSTLPEFFRWVTSHASGAGLPMWGQIAFDRVLETGRIAISSIVPLQSVWGVSALCLLLMAAAWGMRSALRRGDGPTIRMIAWLTASYFAYLPFIIWWDPSPEWFIIPNLFLGGLLVYSLGCLDRRIAGTILAVTITITAIVNFSSTIWPRFKTPNRSLQLAECVAANTRPSDLVLAADWNWAGYLGYFYGRSDVGFIQTVSLYGDKEVGLRTIRQRIMDAQASSGQAYTIEPTSYSKTHLAWLFAQTQITLEDLEEFKGTPAFQCQEKLFWRAPALSSGSPHRVARREIALSLPASSAASIGSARVGLTPSVGYAQVVADASSPLSAFAVLDFQSGGAVLEEVLLPLSAESTSARIYAEIGGGINTGVSFTNPNEEPAGVSFHLRAADGSHLKSGFVEIPPRGQISSFLTDEPFNAEPSQSGTFAFESTAPISTVALRMAANKFSEPVFSRLEVVDTPVRGNDRLLLPFFKVGDGWSSDVVLMNPTKNRTEGRLEYVFTDFSQGTLPYAIPPEGVQRIPLPQSSQLKRGFCPAASRQR
jgi:hypothetical protein